MTPVSAEVDVGDYYQINFSLRRLFLVFHSLALSAVKRGSESEPGSEKLPVKKSFGKFKSLSYQVIDWKIDPKFHGAKIQYQCKAIIGCLLS